MNDLVFVEVFDAEQNLVHKVSGLRLGHGLPPLVQLHERSSPTKLQDNVNEVAVLEVAVELDDESMAQSFVQSDLLRHFVPLVLLHQERLGHDLAGQDLARARVLQLVTFGETTL